MDDQGGTGLKGGRVLIVEDDPKLALLLEQELSHEGYKVEAVGTGSDALLRTEEQEFELILLDLNLPDFDGIEVARLVGKRSEASILMLTARADVDSRIKGLYAGASDYLAKPFSIQELLARVHARLRDRDTPSVLAAGSVVLDPVGASCTVAGELVALTAREFELLALLLEHRGRIFGREELESRLYHGELPDSNTIEVFVSKLRTKLREAGEGSLVQTVRGAGYVIP
ncbi:MAG: response regulator transcription factor [Trueperaceae bacterium]